MQLFHSNLWHTEVQGLKNTELKVEENFKREKIVRSIKRVK